MDSFQLIPVDGLPPFHGGGVGYVAYDAVHYFEPRVPMPESDPQGLARVGVYVHRYIAGV